ncbi:hypothetical protein DFP72DRAFT_885839 [Ephemerocybe angulata]|uniref:BTB domain-containing protein n=1 Tax=Ephemerocybe angulata TaxID=980116 RepID=A0A8H6I776_9AGAR|nr:hypothetical protein DFP72DRAFT_885839 [Tulosesus angulatus]
MPKRRRTEDTNDGPTVGESPKPCEDVWFDDGNIVLQAENMQFKVHKSVLGKHSVVFSDLFEMPHVNDEPTVDGCPIVELHDSAEDIKHMALRLYGDKDHTGGDALPMAVVAAMVRMGRKYDIEHIKNEGLNHLKKTFPAELSSWDHNYENAPPSIKCKPGQGDLEIALEAIKLAHECDVKTILPACYLTVCYYRTGTSAHVIPTEVEGQCSFGAADLLEVRNQAIYGWISELGEKAQCSNQDICLDMGRYLMKKIWRYTRLSSTFDRWTNVARIYHAYIGQLCTFCSRTAEGSHEENRRDVWDELPSYFGLPNWGSLKDFEN